MNVVYFQSVRAVFLLTALLSPWLATQACSCRPLEPGTENEEKRAALYMSLADQALRVKVVSRGASGELLTYKVQVIETIKSTRRAGTEATVTTGLCAEQLHVGEEWLLFVRKGEIAMCRGDELLSNGSAERFPTALGEPGFNSQWADAQYKSAAGWLKRARAAAKAAPRNADGSFREPREYTPPPVVAPPSWLKGEAAGQYLQFGMPELNSIATQLDLLTAERCGKALKGMAANQQMLKDGAAQMYRCTATSDADRLGFRALLRNKVTGRELEVLTQSLDYCASMLNTLAAESRAAEVEVLRECYAK